ncbi:MAG: type IV pili methyl-accepting chemotaxis transducer N-terminal domain-containing protein [Azonexus sp.]|nr:type IV pili methyl-accepting chemotaxis transducer N-terminal domain-containing protein [Azonexus sp.]MCK6413361.1 type IV pili methyl-accepting chemotaxis transducer N-terminal domain-containing protein [Azonexus sp.]
MLLPPGNLSRKIVGTLIAFFVVATAAVGLTLAISWQLEGVAAAINDAGSQRMRLYRISYLMSRVLGDQSAPRAVKELALELQRFDQVFADLRHGDPSRPLAEPRDAEVKQRLDALLVSWDAQLRPLLTLFLSAERTRRESLRDQYDLVLEPFVGNINYLVLAMEQSYASDTRLLRTLQAILVLLSIAGTLMLISFFFRLVIRPVNILHSGLQRMTGNDLSVRLPVNSNDELGRLADGFNRMAEHLQQAYGTLEQRVEAETRSLAERNRELGILYEVTAFLSEPAPLEILCQGFLSRIRGALGANGAAVRLYHPQSEMLYIIAHEGLSDDFIASEGEMNCADCLCGGVIESGIPIAFHTVNPPVGMKMMTCVREGFSIASAFNIVCEKQQLGVFNLYFSRPAGLSEREVRLLETLGQHLGGAIETQRLKAREKKLAVSEERNLLAQELHDSIAQGLAFLNIQVQLLQDSLRHEDLRESLQIAGQLREGVQESYDYVRELLLHFRTRLNQADLESAIRGALEKFERQTGISSEFICQGGGMPLAPEDEIQMMHIVQESLSNIRKHAQASHVQVSLHRSQGRVEIVVEDDGVGFDTVNEAKVLSDRHVGLKIMRERAERIGGECRITSKIGGGTQVTLRRPR